MLQILLLHAYVASVGIRAQLGSYHGMKITWGNARCCRWWVWMRWGCTQCTIRSVLSMNRGVVWWAFKAAHRLSRWKSTSKLPSKSMFCGGGGGSWYRAGGCDIKEDDEYIERVCLVDWDSPPIYDDYLEDFSQGEKIELDKNKVIYIWDELITHIVDKTFDFQKQKVIDPFWEDFIEQELIEVNKKRERVILSNLCRGGNMKFMDVCLDSFLVFASYISPWQKMSRIKIHTSRFIMSEKRLIVAY